MSRKGGTGRVGWDHPQVDMHMVAARLGCKSTMVGTGWANLVTSTWWLLSLAVKVP